MSSVVSELCSCLKSVAGASVVTMLCYICKPCLARNDQIVFSARTSKHWLIWTHCHSSHGASISLISKLIYICWSKGDRIDVCQPENEKRGLLSSTSVWDWGSILLNYFKFQTMTQLLTLSDVREQQQQKGAGDWNSPESCIVINLLFLIDTSHHI